MSNLSTDIVWKFIEKTSAQVISFVVSIVLARLLLPEEYGLIAMVNAFILIADVFLSAGFSNALVQKNDSDDKDFSTVFIINLIISFAIYILLFVLAPIIANFYEEYKLVLVLRILGVKLLFSAYGGIQQAYISRHMMFKNTAVVTILATLFSGVCGVLSAALGGGVWALVIQQLTLVVVQIVLLQLVIKWYPRLVFSSDRAKAMFSYGIHYLFANLLDTISTQLRSLVIGKFYSGSELAYYNRGDSYPQLLLNSINNTMHVVLFAAYSKKHEQKREIKKLVRKSIRMGSFVIFPMMTGLAFVAKPLITILLTAKWLACVPFLQIACLTYATWILQIVNQEAITAMGFADIYFRITIIRSCFNIIVLLLAVRMNVFCVAISAAVANMFSTVLVMHYTENIFGYNLFEMLCDIVRTIICCTVMGAIVYFESQFIHSSFVLLAIQVLSGVAVYLGASFFINREALNYVCDSYIKRR